MSDGDLDALRSQRMSQLQSQFVSNLQRRQCVLSMDARVAKNNHKIYKESFVYIYIYVYMQSCDAADAQNMID